MDQNSKSDAPQIPAAVLGFHGEYTASETQQYPAALPAPQGVPAAKLDEAAPKTLEDGGAAPAGYGSQAPAPRMSPRDFYSGIFDCQHSWAICADAWLCTYCVASAQHNFLVNESEGIFWPLCTGLFCVDVGLSALDFPTPSALCFHTWFMRQAMRKRYNLHLEQQSESGSDGAPEASNMECLFDFLTVFCCTVCTIAQHQREIMHQGDWCGGVFTTRSSLQVPAEVHTI